MLSEQLAKIAYNGGDMPKNLEPPEVMLFQSMAALSLRYRMGGISAEKASTEKQGIYNAYRRMRADYDNLLEVCKLYQTRLREGYGRNESTN